MQLYSFSVMLCLCMQVDSRCHGDHCAHTYCWLVAFNVRNFDSLLSPSQIVGSSCLSVLLYSMCEILALVGIRWCMHTVDMTAASALTCSNSA